MALMDDETTRLLRQSLNAQQQMLRQLQGLHTAAQAQQDMARRFSAQQQEEQQQQRFNAPQQQNGDASSVAAAMASPRRGEGGGGSQTATAAAATEAADDAVPANGEEQGESEGPSYGGVNDPYAGPGTPRAQSRGGQPQAGAGGAGGGAGGGQQQGDQSTPSGGSGPQAASGGIMTGLMGMVNKIPGMNMLLAPYNFLSSQRDKDDYYQSINGGSDFDAVKSRVGEEGAVASNLGVMSTADARAAYKDISRLGYSDSSASKTNDGYSRSELMGYVTHAKTNRGQSEQESIQDLSTWQSTGTEDLKEFNAAMDEVSETARKSGINLMQARAQMRSTMQTATSEGTMSGHGAQVAGRAITDANNQMGKTYSQGVDASGMVADAYQQRQAAMSGYKIGEFQNMASKGDPRYYQAINKYNHKIADQMFGDTGGKDDQWIRNYAKQHPKATTQQISQAYRDYYTKNQGGSVDVNQLAGNVSSATGVKFKNTDQVFAWKAGQALGKTDLKPKKYDAEGSKTGEGKNDKNTFGYNSHRGASGKVKSGKTGAAIGKDLLGGPSFLGGLGGVVGTLGGGYIDRKYGSSIKKFFGFGDDNKVTVTPPATEAAKKAAKKQQDAATKKFGETAGNLFGHSKSATTAKKTTSTPKVKVELTGDAKKLLKAIVVTGGDPYKSANQASSGRPSTGSSNTTR